MLAKLASRKLWATVVTALIVGFGGQLGIDPETVEKLVQLAMTYIIGQGVVDAANQYRSTSL